MIKKEKILLILTPGFPSGEQDSTCLPAQQEFVLSIGRTTPGIKPVILAFQYPFRKGNYKWHGIEVIAFNGRNRSRLHRLLVWRRIWIKMNELHQNYLVAGIISFWYGECCLLGNRFARKHSLLHFCWILGQDARAGNPYIARTRAPGGELVAMSDFLSDEFFRNYSIRPQHVFTNGVSAYSKNKTDIRDIDVLGAGSLIPLKQYSLFIECIREAKLYHPTIKALICGKGPENENLGEQIIACGLNENIKLVDEVDHAEVLQLMRRSRILLHPSSYEGFSSVCLEALASGAHVVSYCQPMHHSIPHWYVAGTLEQMKTILNGLLQNPSLEHVPIVPYRIDEVAQKWMQLFATQPAAKLEQLV